jgi:hypothetical protein
MKKQIKNRVMMLVTGPQYESGLFQPQADHQVVL